MAPSLKPGRPAPITDDEMTSVLLVDDEPLILQALQDSLRLWRDEWCVRVATGGGSAVAQLTHESADVVVSDFRMDDMDGEALLSRVAVEHPRAVRIMLSGYRLRAGTGTAHAVIEKPCVGEALALAIEATCDRIESSCRGPSATERPIFPGREAGSHDSRHDGRGGRQRAAQPRGLAFKTRPSGGSRRPPRA